MNTTQYQLSTGEKLVNFPNGIPGKGDVRTGYTWYLVGGKEAYKVVSELLDADLEEYIHRSCPPNELLLPLAERGRYIIVQSYAPKEYPDLEEPERYSDLAYFDIERGGWF